MRSRLTALRGAEQALRGAGVFSARPIATSSDPARIVATASGSAVKASFSVTVSALARADVRTQSTALAAAGAADTLHLASGATSVDVSIAAGDSIATIASKINTIGGGVSASVVDGKLRLTSRDTGAANAVSLTSDGSLAADLGLTVTLAGQDAQLSVDGIARSSASNRVSDAIPGVTLDLRAATAGTPVTITSDPAGVDADAVIAKAKAFVAAYNGTVDALRTAIGERPDPAGAGSVTKGAFYADGLYTDLLANLNRAVSDTVAGLGSTRNQAATVGLSSGAATRRDGGRLAQRPPGAGRVEAARGARRRSRRGRRAAGRGRAAGHRRAARLGDRGLHRLDRRPGWPRGRRDGPARRVPCLDRPGRRAPDAARGAAALRSSRPWNGVSASCATCSRGSARSSTLPRNESGSYRS